MSRNSEHQLVAFPVAIVSRRGGRCKTHAAAERLFSDDFQQIKLLQGQDSVWVRHRAIKLGAGQPVISDRREIEELSTDDLCKSPDYLRAGVFFA